MTTPITKHNFQVKHPDEIPSVVHQAFHIANTGRKGPVVIDFPKDVGILKSEVDVTDELDLPGYHLADAPEPSDIDYVLAKLKDAKKPVLLVGAGVRHSQSGPQLTEFAERHQIPVVTTLHGLGTIPYEIPSS